MESPALFVVSRIFAVTYALFGYFWSICFIFKIFGSILVISGQILYIFLTHYQQVLGKRIRFPVGLELFAGLISGTSQAYLRYVLGISKAYLMYILGIYQVYLRHFSVIFQACSKYISCISQVKLSHISDTSEVSVSGKSRAYISNISQTYFRHICILTHDMFHSSSATVPAKPSSSYAGLRQH